MVETMIGRTTPRNGEYRRTLCFDPAERERDFANWFSTLDLRPQCAGDLGVRMRAAIEESLARGADRVVLIGSDCPDLDRDLILEAFRRLEASDLVIGPATDGGYYLIGMKNVHDIFTEIPWSTGRVFQETMEKVKGAGLKVALLPTLSDVDEIA
jgi:hypothetical protein